MKILVLDNYDSFTYNLVQYLDEITTHQINVFRNDKIAIDEVEKYDCIVLSPGPGLPKDAGIMPELIKTYAQSKPILGICLGHQAIGECFGSKLENLKFAFHGVATPIKQNGLKSEIFQDIPTRFQAGRYHSWVIKKDTLVDELECIAVDDQTQIMAIKHKTKPIFGLQFHPESILTDHGKQMLKNFIDHCENLVES